MFNAKFSETFCEREERNCFTSECEFFLDPDGALYHCQVGRWSWKLTEILTSVNNGSIFTAQSSWKRVYKS
jgi:hypothetical protein